MQTEQKTFWIRHLTFGILSSFLLFSCNGYQDQINPVNDRKALLINATGLPIKIYRWSGGDRNGLEIHSIMSNDTLINELVPCTYNGQKSKLSLKRGCYFINSDSVKIIFNETKFVKYTPNTPSNRNVLQEENYYNEKNRRNQYIFTYAFIDEDYLTAIPIAFDNLLGSVWWCTAGAGLQDGVRYNELRFVSNTTVEGWALTTEDPTPEHLFTATYTIANQTITISDGEDDFFVATLNETQDLVTNIDDEGECVYQRQ